MASERSRRDAGTCSSSTLLAFSERAQDRDIAHATSSDLGMTKPLPSWAYSVLSICGAVLVASMLVSWVSAMGESHSGLGLAWHDNHWLFLVPLVGAALAITSATRSELTRLAAIAAGVTITGYVLFQFAKSVVFDGGVDSWLVFGGAGAILGGVSPRRSSWRIAGGVAVLAGFFAPWSDHSMFDALTSDEVAFLRDGLGVTVRILWLIPLAGLAAIGSGVSASTSSGRLALASGLAVFGAVAWTIGSFANLVLAWGAWAAVAASAIALVVGVLAPGSARR